MLLELKVRNLAIIESVEISFGVGLNVFTGETGAGKSILLEALGLVLGGRSDRDLVRTGQKEAWVEALFDMDPVLLPYLESSGIEANLDEPLALRRVVQSTGRSRAYVNCVSVPAALLRQMAPFLVDFGRQHDQATLMNPRNHLDLLDKYANSFEERDFVEKRHQKVSNLLQEREQLSENQVHRQERLEFLEFQYSSIQDIDPQPNEINELNQELKSLEQGKKKLELLGEAYGILSASPGGVRDQLSSALSPLKKFTDLEEEELTFHDELQHALILVEELARSLKDHQKEIVLDPMRLKEVEERLDQLLKLQQKYGGDFKSVFKRLQELETEMEELLQQNQREKKLNKLIRQAQKALLEAAQPLTQKRQKATEELVENVEVELSDLAMQNARFRIKFSPLKGEEGIPCPTGPEPIDLEEDASYARVGARGAERATFMLAANPGEVPRPLERVASGGELSRILLALKRVLANATEVQAFVFDEIDAGVAGAAATMIAKKLRQIASEGTEQYSQIICITHTPQIAAEADTHLHISKATQEDGRTRSVVRCLRMEERIYEIARMLAGSQSMERALDLARELLGCQGMLAVAS